MRVSVQDSVCLVTGANRGIGRALVDALIFHGAAKVYAGVRQPETAKSLVAAAKGKVTTLKLDVTNAQDVRAAMHNATDVNILINNAGVAAYTGILSKLDALDAGRLEMEVNYFGLLNMTRAFAAILGRNGGGALVNISSIGGLIGIPSFGTYCASKAAVHSLTQSVRGELKAQGTFVACVYPGPIDTDMTGTVDMQKESPSNAARQIVRGIEAGEEEIYPDKFAREFARKFRTDAKALEREWSTTLPS